MQNLKEKIQNKSIRKLLRSILAVLILIAISSFVLISKKYETKNENNIYIPNDINQILSGINEDKSLSPYDAVYNIWGEDIKLRNGESRISISPGSSVEMVTKYFGNDLKFDLDHDGREDIIFMLTQETGGTGIFYYVSAVLNKEEGRVGLDGVYVGDRVAPGSMYMEPGEILVINFAERRIGESFAEQPSIGRTIRVKYDEDTHQFAEVLQAQSY